MPWSDWSCDELGDKTLLGDTDGDQRGDATQLGDTAGISVVTTPGSVIPLVMETANETTR